MHDQPFATLAFCARQSLPKNLTHHTFIFIHFRLIDDVMHVKCYAVILIKRDCKVGGGGCCHHPQLRLGAITLNCIACFLFEFYHFSPLSLFFFLKDYP